MVEQDLKGRTVVCIGTGPSLTLADVDIARKKGFVLTGVNNVALDVPDLAVLYAVNYPWWELYWDRVKDHPAEKWTTNKAAAAMFGLNWIEETDGVGLSTNPKIVHHGHGSGYTLLNLIYLMAASRIILLGYDLKYAPGYRGRERVIGETARHYWSENGGEYPPTLQHWPSVCVRDGIHFDLVKRYGEVAQQNSVEIVNCTRDTALECFPRVDIAEVPT